MTGTKKYSAIATASRHIVLDMRDCFTCSFTEFYPFCNALFYFSSYKDFDTTQA